MTTREACLALAIFLITTGAGAIEPATAPVSDDAFDWVTHINPDSPLLADAIPFEALKDDKTHIDWMSAREEDHVALSGLDPVSFFYGNAPQQGNSAFSVSRHGATFLFASDANRQKFLAEPERYEPAYGGYDPEAVAMGLLLKPGEGQWTIYNGRLYLSNSPELRAEFDRHRPEVIKAADAKWKTADDLFERRFYRIHKD